MHWVWSKACRNWITNLQQGWCFGALGGLLISFAIIFLSGKYEFSDLPLIVLIGLLEGLIFGTQLGVLMGTLINILGGALVENEITTRALPNEGILLSLRNALIYGFYGLFVGLFIGLILFYYIAGTDINRPYSKIALLLLILVTGLIFGMIFCLQKGGIACLQHFTLRFLLWCNGFAPLRYTRFFDYAVERIFLRKVGGGYIFVHQMLLEYFAALHPGRTEIKQKNH